MSRVPFVKIGEIGTVVSGSTPKTSVEAYWKDGSILWLTPTDLRDETKYVANSERKITEAGLRSANLKLVPKGTVLLTSRAPIGKVAIATTELCTNQGFKNIVCLEERINSDYLYYYLKSRTDFLNNLGRGATFKEISKTIVENIEIPHPPLETQKKIADTLDKAQELIDKRKQQIEMLDELLQSVFLDMFGDPVNNPKGWPTREFSDVCTNHDSKRVPIKKQDRTKMSGQYPYYGATGIIDYLNDYIFHGDFLLIAEDGKNLVTRNKPIAFPASGKSWANNHAHVISSNGICDLTYLRYYIESISIQKYVTGIDQFKLNRGNLDRLTVHVPALELQNMFADIVRKSEQQKFSMEESLAEMANNFQSIMQKAFRGELFS